MSFSIVRLVLALLFLAAAFPASGAVRITEFLASNLRGLTDEDSNHEDWIEIYNDGASPVSLDGWYLTDNASNLTKWRFPNTNIGPTQFIVVFASDKNRRVPGAPLHTNFKLSDNGEYLALVQPDGTTIATQFAPTYPVQATDISYGFSALQTKTVLAQGAAAKWRVWTNAPDFSAQSSGWNTNLAYVTTVWSNGTSGLGWDDTTSPVDFTSYFGSNANPRSLIAGQSRALFTRFLPVLTNVASTTSLKLRMKFDDGFIAWLNGTLVASNLAPTTPSWDSLATGTRDDTLNSAWATFDLPLSAGVEGTNLLAIQTFNTTTNSSDLLLLPELDMLLPSSGSSSAAYLNVPTPGVVNGSGSSAVPPVVELLTKPARPLGGPAGSSITVTALVTQTLFPITNVTLFHRVMFSNEVAVTMTAGTGGLYTASVPTAGLSAGQMLRWRVEAKDSSTNIGTAPRFLDANDDDRYHGTVALNNSAETNSLLPIVHLFVEDYGAISAESGGRCTLFYLDRFYDNIFAKLHGQSTAGFLKKSHDMDFNAGNRFKWREGENEAKDINLLSNWADKSKVRNTLAYEMFNRAGLLAHWAFPVRVQSNGVFHAIADMVEDGDDRYLERVGLDPNGALYKVYNSQSGTGTWSAEKKSRKQEGNADLVAFNAGITTALTMPQRRSYTYDNVDIAATINYLAAIVVNSCTDQGHKNFYLYRDSDGTREWRLLPWDADLTFGHDWLSGPGYFDDNIYVNQSLQLGVVNNFKDIIFNNSELNQIYLRRLRTLMDEVLQPSSTPVNLRTNENRIAELLNLMDPPGITTSDADQDFAKWGWWTNSTRQVSANAAQEIRPQAQRIIDSYLPGRRSFLAAVPLSSGAGIPASQTTNANIAVEIGDFNPAGGNQAQEYIRLRNTNAFAVDISGWKLSSAIDYTFPPGTIIPSSTLSVNVGLLFVTKDPYAFRQRTVAPTSNQFCLVSGPYSGQLSARGETVVLTDKFGRIITSVSYVGAPSLAQQFLRITELMYNPAPLAGSTNDAQEFEFIELRNTSPSVTLNLQGVSFTNGIMFTFTNSTLLSPQQSLILARNPVAFTQRYGSGFNLAGPYVGYLDNGGERLTLLDGVNEEVLDFSYNNAWYPITDGLGFSLVVVDQNAAPDSWDSKSNWRASGALQGSPGTTDSYPLFVSIKVNEVLAHTDLPQVDSIELFNPSTNAVNIGGWFITDNFFVPKKYRIATGTAIPPLSYIVFNENQFNNQPVVTNNFRLTSTGDDVWLFSADATANLTGYYHGFDFGASANGVSLGRHVTSVGVEHFVAQRSLTLGTNNSGPLVGPVIIRAIMYHPPDVISNTVLVDDDLNEFIELLNTASTNVSLFSAVAPTNTWRLRDAVDVSFPTNLSLTAGSNLFVVGFNPTNTAQLAAFRAKWNFSASVPVFGPWSGKLDNSADDVKLERPDAPNLDGSVPFILVERVQYADAAPWLAGADGLGAALQRRVYSDYANDPINWNALPLPGTVVSDTDGDGMADWWELNNGLNVLTNEAALDLDGDGMSNLQESVARTNPQDAASVLHLQIAKVASNVVLSFEAQPQLSYAVQTNTSLSSGFWQTWQSLAAAPTNRMIILTNSNPGATIFYRLRAPAN